MQPHTIRCFALAAAASLTLGLVACDPKPGTNPADPPVEVPKPAYGANTGIATGGQILWESDADFQRDVDAIVASGASWVRIDFDWHSIQYEGPNSWRWDRATDRMVRAFHARGLKILGTLVYSPPWARRAACAATKNCLPQNPVDYAAFAVQAVERYGNGLGNGGPGELRNTVNAWEIWNEPNHYPFVQPTVDVPGYTTLLKTAYPAIKAADPTTTVVTGGTAPAPDSTNGRDVAPITFVNGIYANGGKGFFDAIGHHPYSGPLGPMYSASWNAFTQTVTIYTRMFANGDGAKKVWGTEAGSATGTYSSAVSEATQAQFVSDFFKGWNKNFGGFTGPFFWYQHRDQGNNKADREQNLGLLHNNWSPKPAFTVFQNEMNGT